MVGSAISLLRRSLLIGAAAACAAALLPAVAHAAGLAPDPAPATASATVHPDAYPVIVATPRAPAAPTAPPRAFRPVVAAAQVFRPPSHRATAAPARRPAPHPRHVPATRPQARTPVRLPFPTLAIKWFSGATGPVAAEARREVPARVALLLAALVLASAAFVAGAAREAVR